MPRFLDSHPMKGFDEPTLRKLQNAPKDEFGITHANIVFSEKENKVFCLLDAPDKNAVIDHHKKGGVTTDWVMEVKTTK
jgi:hypothetical protein